MFCQELDLLETQGTVDVKLMQPNLCAGQNRVVAACMDASCLDTGA